VRTGFEIARFENGGETALNNSGSRLVVISQGNVARVWTDDGSELACLKHQHPIRSARLTPDGARVVTASEDDTARVWDVASGTELARLRHAGVRALTLSPDGAQLLTRSEQLLTSAGKVAMLWELTSGRELARFGHEHYVNSATFNRDGTLVATC